MIGWRQVNEDGFGYPPDPEDGQTTLFTFGGHLYANHYKGLYRMDDPLKKSWAKVFDQPQYFIPLDKYLYRYQNDGLWWINQGEEFSAANWKQVTSKGLPGGVNPIPKTTFNGKVYALYRYQTATGVWIFEIWRSQDIGKTIMNWQQVVTQSFGDPQNNKDVDFMGVFSSKIYVGTNTLEYIFGVPQPTAGVEIWESATGDAGSWTQVNVDGFGTEVALLSENRKIR